MNGCLRRVRLFFTLGLCTTFLLAGCGGQTTALGADTRPDIESAPPEIESALHYIKASNTGFSDNFGQSIALSADGSTLAIGAFGEASDAVGINKDQGNDNSSSSGAVYVFVRNGKTWVQQAYIKASNPDANDLFGISVALSANGHTLAVGATDEDSSTGSDPYDNNARGAGAVYVFSRDGTEWSQRAYLKSDLPRADDYFGRSVAFSGDGHMLAVGSPGEASDGTPHNTALDDSGAVYIFNRTGSSWSQTALLKASNAAELDQFGISVSLSESGDTLAVGAESKSNGVDFAAGAAYIFKRTDLHWSEVDYLKASNPDENDHFGYSVVLSGDGLTLAVGAPIEASGANTVNDLNGQLNNDLPAAGAVYVFSLSGGIWGQHSYVKASNSIEVALFGSTVALSGDGSTLMVGATGDRSKATGINGSQGDDSAFSAGAAYVFTRSADTWHQRAYVKASNTDEQDYFGSAVAMSADARTFAVGAPKERSKATGVDGDPLDNSVSEAGAVYVLNTLN